MYKRYIIFILMIFLFLLFTVTSLSADTDNVEKIQTRQSHSIGYCLGRGLSNICLGWIEIPRRISYQGSEIPFFGLFSGAAYGVSLTVWRAFSGVTDFISFGMGGGNSFFKFGLPDFPWNGPWVKKPKHIK
ncbi:MAG: hypothetical protein K9L78_02970 [Victivallales bacterium]|nr:hypothetical protein [Victivallales bacterium]MCF7889059.1 hypothetical protein [Victivallales bacterium]